MQTFKRIAVGAFLCPTLNKRFILCSSFACFHSLLPATVASERAGDLQTKEVASSFKDWFRSRNDALLDHIFEILSSQADDLVSRRSAESTLSCLGLRLSEEFVLKVLNHGKDVLSCLKFFDWAGRQSGYHHTRATFNAIFKILSRAKLMSIMIDFLETYTNQRYMHKVRFYDTLVMGYSVAGKPEIALQLFGRMRFVGVDLDSFAYHVLLNALVEENLFDVVEIVAKQIKMRGFESEITSGIMVKNFVKQKKLEEAEAFIRGLVSNGGAVNENVVCVVIDALCKQNKFEEASRLMDEFKEIGKFSMKHIYDVWVRDLVQAGKVDGAMEFVRSMKLAEGYFPDLFRYNILICKLLRENRLEEACDLLMEMKEGKISPDKVTMNAALCFFCKAGMVDVALDLYNSRKEFGLSPNSMAYNYLINTLCGDGSVDEAYRVLKNSIEQGYFPGRKTFSILADALCREGKLDKMKELLVVALEQNVVPNDALYDKFISALCKAKRVEDGYLIHGELHKLDKVATRKTYINLISGFNKSSRGDIAKRLLIEMQESGHTPSRSLYRSVIRCLCDAENPENQFLKLLEMQLSHHEAESRDYNFFIDGAGHAKKPDLARKAFEMMVRSGVKPNLSSDILMLQSYLKSERISDALNFFGDLCKRRKAGRKFYHTVIAGLCNANKPDIALELLREMKEKELVPSIQCYEELVQSLCSNKNYDMVVKIIDDLQKSGRHVSSFIGNILLLHSLRSRELYEAWVRSGGVLGDESLSGCLTLGELVGAFSGRIRVNGNIENLEEVIGQCFPLDLFTYNMLLRRLSTNETMDYAYDVFNRIHDKGYEPNRWTYDILVHGLFKHGRTNEAKRWLNEMIQKGFDPTDRTRQLI
ncbi:pentatricopeptide repeat-containing protein At1g71210, mitochondrial [Telopea speciosissima]|uniref:pentatricopeptide repeat-containing protein At1g71210, mitochondrial n=1 Tax=Telopea speciosissima TaxID=54955 RepID=UPI001CC5B903|nr:pentatricopeptide repeat-containing protein At1g71210, mitochondrial [Telopea speciosissima]XP_043721396.1 pentatricopeptide repeat-containing protein At1g71210, mitochondrial [Telopea speciosissima]